MARTRLPALPEIAAAAAATLKRFPLTLAASVFLALLLINLFGGFDWYGQDEIQRRLIQFTMSSIFLTIAGQIFAEANGLGRYGVVLSLVGVGLAAALELPGASPRLTPDFVPLSFVTLAGMLLLAAAPTAIAADDNCFWQANRHMWLGAAFGFLVALLIMIGLSLGLGTVALLFDADWPEEIYGFIFALSFAVVWPWVTLSLVPARLGALGGRDMPRLLALLAARLLAPLAVFYGAIIYAYIIYIALQGAVPKGQVGYFVGGYAAFGVVVYVLAFPLDDGGRRLIGLFRRYFFFALVAPIALLAVAAWLRIADHGLTEWRYLLVVVTSWLAAMAVLFIARPRSRLALLPLSLAVLLLVGGFGPWGATQLSLASQFGRLEADLADLGILRDQRITAPVDEVPLDTAKRISGVVDYLYRSDHKPRLDQWLAARGVTVEPGAYVDKYVTALHVPYVNPWGVAVTGYLYPQAEDGFDVTGFERVLRLTASQGNFVQPRAIDNFLPGQSVSLGFDDASGSLTLSIAGSAGVTLDLTPLAEEALRQSQGVPVAGVRLVEAEGPALRARLYVEGLTAEQVGGPARAIQVTGLLLLARRP